LQTAFIKQEALEKAREIKVKADEEFAIEKVRAAWCSSPSLVTAALVNRGVPIGRGGMTMSFSVVRGRTAG
jgi:hypothetical protein